MLLAGCTGGVNETLFWSLISQKCNYYLMISMRTPKLTNAVAWISRLSPLVHVLRVRARTRARGWYSAHTGARLVSFTHFAFVTNTPPHLWAGLCFLTWIFSKCFPLSLIFPSSAGDEDKSNASFSLYFSYYFRTNIQEFSIALFTHAAITVLLPTKITSAQVETDSGNVLS
jgi:hypothetical protein